MADFTIHDLDLPVQQQTTANGYAPDSSASVAPISKNYPSTSYEENTQQKEDDPLDSIKKDALTPSLQSKYNEDHFDWDDSRVQKFVNTPQYKTLGFDSKLGQQIEDEKYHEFESNGETLKRTAEGFGVGLGQGFIGMVTNLKNIGSVFSDPTLQSSFKKQQLEEINKKQQDFDDNYYIPQGTNPGILNRVARGVQESGNFIGSLAEIAAFSWLTGGIGGVIEGTGVEAGTAIGLEEATPDLIANTEKLTSAINKGTNPSLWNQIGKIASAAGQKLPLPGANSLAFGGDILQGSEGATMATAARGFGAFANDINTVNTATGFASGNAAATYQQMVNDQVEQYKKQNGGKEPDMLSVQGFQDTALKAAKTDGALNAWSMLFLEKAAFGNLLSSKGATESYLERIGYKDIGIKSGEEAEPFYVKEKFRWNDFKGNLLGNDYEGAKSLLAKGAEFGAFGNLMSGIDKTVKSYYDAKVENHDIDWLDAVHDGINSQFTKEGAGTFISGFVQGALLLGIGGAALGKLKDSGIDAVKDKYRKNTMTPEEYKTYQEKSASDKLNYQRGQYQFINDMNDSWKDPLSKVQDTFKGMTLQNMFAEAGKTSLAKQDDVKGFHDIKDDATRDFLLKMARNGLGDMWVNRMQQYANTLSSDELCTTVGVPKTPENAQQIKEQISELPGRIKSLKRISKAVDKTLGSPFNPHTIDQTTGKRLYPDGSDEFKVQQNNKAIHDLAKDMLITMHDEAERKIVRKVELLNGKGDSKGILGMPFAENLNFSTIDNATSPDMLSREADLYNQELGVTDKGKGAVTDKKNAVLDYKTVLDKYIDGMQQIYTKGGYSERAADIVKHRNEYREQLTQKLHKYLSESLKEVNIDGKVSQVRKPPTVEQVRDGIDKMMDYYDLGMEHDRLLDNLNILMNPKIIKDYQMSFFNEAADRQKKAYEKANKEETDLKTERQKLVSQIAKQQSDWTEGKREGTDTEKQRIKEWQDRVNEIDKRLTDIGKPVPVEPVTTAPTDAPTPEKPKPVDNEPVSIDIEKSIREHFTLDKPLSPEATEYLKHNPELNTNLIGAKGIAGKMDEEHADEFLEHQVNKLLGDHFDKSVEPLKFEHLPGKPEVRKVDSKYEITGSTVKYDSIREANKALQDLYPIVTVNGQQLQIGQYVYDTDGNRYILKGNTTVQNNKGKLIIIGPDDVYTSTKPDETPGKPHIPENRLYQSNVAELTEIRPAGLTEDDKKVNRIAVDNVLRNLHPDNVSDSISMTVTKGPNAGGTYQNGSIQDNPYIKFRNDDYTIQIHVAGLDKPMYVQSPFKNLYTIDGKETTELPKDKFHLVYDLQGRPLDEVYNEYQTQVTKMQQLADVLPHIIENGGTLSGEQLQKLIKITPSAGELSFAPTDQRPTLQQIADTGKQIVAVVNRDTDEVLWGKLADSAQVPLRADKNANTGSKHMVAIQLNNGTIRFGELHTPKIEVPLTEGETGSLVADINSHSAEVRDIKSNGGDTTEIKKTINSRMPFITMYPTGPVSIYFTPRMMDNGFINVGMQIRAPKQTLDVNGKPVITKELLNNDKGQNSHQVWIAPKDESKPLDIKDTDDLLRKLENKVNSYLSRPEIRAAIGEQHYERYLSGGQEKFKLKEPIKFTSDNLRKSYTPGENGQLDTDTVMQSTTNLSTDVVHNQKLNYSVDKSALITDSVPEEPYIPEEPPFIDEDDDGGELRAMASIIGSIKPIVDIQPIPEDPDDMLKQFDKGVRKVDSKIEPFDKPFTADDVVDINSFVADLKDKLPEFVDVIDNIHNELINGHGLLGEFVMDLQKIRGTIRTAAENPYKYHEAFHAVYRMLLTPAEQRRLLNDAHTVNPVTDAELREFRERGYGSGDDTKDRDTFQEEWMADKFDAWKKDHKTAVPGSIRAFFEKLWNFIKELFNRLTGNELESMFYKYNRGSFAHTKLQENEFTTTPNPPAMKLIELPGTDEVEINGKPVKLSRTLPQDVGIQLSNTVAALYHIVKLDKGLSHEKTLNEIRKDYLDTLNPREQRYKDEFIRRRAINPEDAKQWYRELYDRHSVFANDNSWNTLLDTVDDKLKLKNYSAELATDADRKLEQQIGVKSSYDETADMKGGYGTLLPAIREYIEQTVVPGVDDYGNAIMSSGRPVYVAVDGEKVYNGLSQLLRNTPGWDKMMDKLLNGQNHGQSGDVIRRLISNTGLQYESGIWNVTKNLVLFKQFLNGFRKAQVDHIVGDIRGGGESSAYSANRNNSTKIQFEQTAPAFRTLFWEPFQSPKGGRRFANEKLKPFIRLRNYLSETEHDFPSDTKFTEICQKLSNDIKDNLGLSLDPKYIEYSIAKNKLNNTDYMKSLLSTWDATPIAVDNVRQFIELITKAKPENPFIAGANRVEGILKGNVVFDQNINSTNYTDAEGKQRHSLQDFNYLLEQAVKLNDADEITRLNNDPDTADSWMLSDKKFLNATKQLSIVDGLTTGDENGTVSKKFNSREQNAYHFTLYSTPQITNGVYSTWVNMPKISDKSTSYNTLLPVIQSVYHDKNGKLKIAESGMEKLVSIVQSEINRINRVKSEIDTLPESEKIQNRHLPDEDGIIHGLKFSRASAMLGELSKEYEEAIAGNTDLPKMTEYSDIRPQIEKYFLGTDGAINKYINDELVGSGLVRKNGDKYESTGLLPNYLWVGMDSKKSDAMNITNDFRHNVAQVYLSNYINNEGFGQLLFPYNINTKRLSLANAAGPSAYTPFTAPELGIEHPFTEFHMAVLKEPKDENQFDQSDSQVYITEKGMRYTSFGFGTLTGTQAKVLDKLRTGKPISDKEMWGPDGLMKNGGALNPLKPVFYDGKTSVKCSMLMLSKDLVMTKENGKYVPDERKRNLYNIWKSMTDFEDANNTVTAIGPESAFKTVIKNTIPDSGNIRDEHFHKFSTNYLRDQVYLPSEGDHITKPTQPVWQLSAEQDGDTQVMGKSVSEWTNKYNTAVAQRLSVNWSDAINSVFKHLSGKPISLDAPINMDEIEPMLGKFYDQVQETLQATGADEQTIGFFETRDGEPVYPALDFPSTLQKFTQLVMAHVSKAMREQVPGISPVKVSPYGMNVLRQIYEVDDNGTPVPGKWSVIDENPIRYPDVKTYTDVDNRSFSGLKPGDYIIDHPRANVPKFDESGKPTGLFINEYLIPKQHPLQKLGDSLSIGYRNDIPYADKNNGNVFEVVGFLPTHLGQIQVNPSAQNRAGGKDLDADKDTMHMSDVYSNSEKLVPYGSATTDKDKFEEYIMWMASNNKRIKSSVKTLEDTDNAAFTAALVDDDRQVVIQLLHELNLPATVEQFMTVGGDNINPGVLNNRELESKIALAGNSNVTGGDNPINLRPTSVDLLKNLVSDKVGNSFTSILNRYIDEHPDDTEGIQHAHDLLKLFQDPDVNMNEMRGRSIIHKAISAGTGGIGIVAKTIQSVSFLMQHPVEIVDNYITYNGIDYNKLGDRNSTTGIRKFEAIMAYINTMTDNAKLNLASKLGLTTDSLPDAMAMIATGMDISDVQLYMLQPAVRKYYQDIAYLSGTLKTKSEQRLTKKQLLENAIDSYSNEKQITLDRKQLEDSLLHPDNSINLSALQDLKKAQVTKEALFQLSSVLGLASGLPDNWEDVDSIQENLDKLENNEDIPIHTELLKDPIASTYIKMLQQYNELAPALFLEKSELFKRITDIQLANIRKLYGKDTAAVNKQLKQDMISYMFLSADRHINGSNYYNGLIYPSMSGESVTAIIDRLKLLKGLQKNYMVNKLLKSVPAGTDGEIIDKVLFNNWAKLSNPEQIKIRDSYMELLNNSKTHEDAQKLFNYLMVKDGGQFRNGSFIKFIANGVFKDLYDAGARVKQALSRKQYDDITAMELFGKPWGDMMNNFISSWGLHIDNKRYLIDRRLPVTDTANYSMDQLKDMGWNVYGKKDNEQIELPQYYKNGSSVYQLKKVHKPDNGVYTTNLVEPGQLIATGTRGVYEEVGTQGAPRTFRAGSATFGQLPTTSDLSIIKHAPKTIDQIPYSPDSKTEPKSIEVTPTQSIPVANSTQEAVKQLSERHGINIATENGKAVAYQNGNIMSVPANIRNPKQLLDYLDNQRQNEEPDEIDMEDRIARIQQESAKPVVPSQPVNRMEQLYTLADNRVRKAFSNDLPKIHDIGEGTGPDKFHFNEGSGKYVAIDHVFIPEKYRNQGLGLSLYIVRGEELLQNDRILINQDGMSPEAYKIWNRLTELGLATQAGDHATYEYIGLRGLNEIALNENLREKGINNLQPIDWKTEIDKLSTGKPTEWIEKARNVYTRMRGKVPDSEILQAIKDCV